MKSYNQKIVFIGSGNVATYLSEALKGKRDIIQVYSKTLANARKLGQKLGCAFTNDLKKILPDADLYIIAVKDDAIKDVCKKLKLTGKIVAHTSGSVPMDVLKRVSNRHGVIWPPYSFAGNTFSPADKRNLKYISENQRNQQETLGIPFFIEASDKKTENELTALVKGVNGNPYYINSEKRAILHLAAVFVNNFPNHLFAIAESLSKEAGVPFNVFLPIANETVENLKTQSPALSQTGPASRNDKQILGKHIALLRKVNPRYKKVYEVLTKSIIQSERGKKEL